MTPVFVLDQVLSTLFDIDVIGTSSDVSYTVS